MAALTKELIKIKRPAENDSANERPNKCADWSLDPFGDRDNAVAVPCHGLLDFGQEPPPPVAFFHRIGDNG